jgi:hypothetical protein
MTAIPVVIDTEAKTSSWVFEDSEVQEFLYPEGTSPLDDDAEPQANPAYRPELDVTFANSSAHHLMDAIGLGDHFEPGFGYELAIDDFIAAAGRALAQNTVDGDPSGMARRISRALVCATEGRTRGATHLILS